MMIYLLEWDDGENYKGNYIKKRIQIIGLDM